MTDAKATDPNSSTESVFEFDSLMKPEFVSCPQPFYKQMRDTNPVMRGPGLGGAESVWVGRHDDVVFALRNPEIFSSSGGRAFDHESEDAGGSGLPIGLDPPQHVLYRRVLDPLFGPKQMNKLEADIARHVNEMIDGFIDRGECDYADEFAVPLPCGVFLRLMGLPMSDLDFFLQGGINAFRESQENPETAMQASQDHGRKQTKYFQDLIDERRANPQDDVLSALIASKVDGRPLSDNELLSMCNLLVTAGLDTVTDTLTCMYAFLGTHPDYRRRLVEEPEILNSAVEEMLRYESPVPFVLPRTVMQDTELSGCPVKKGDTAMLLLGSANTDERAFSDADVVDFDRNPNRHFAFGGGPHRCLGSHLARLELRVSLREWHRRIPDYHLPEDVELEWATMLRQVKHLPIVFDKVNG